MKKILALFALLALALTACGAQAAPAMYLQPAQLTEKEEAVAKLLGADTDQFLLDVVLDSTVRSLHVQYYELTGDGEWRLFSSSSMALDGSETKGRMAFTYGNLAQESSREAVQFGKSFSAITHTPSPEEEPEDRMYGGSSRLSGRKEITYGQEIPLVLQVVTSKNSTSLYDVDYFFQPEVYASLGYEHVYALTVTFSQDSLGETDANQAPANQAA